MPDLKCTPGAINPAVHQDNIATTICKTGWTKTVRPPTSVTNKIKLRIDLPGHNEGRGAEDRDIAAETDDQRCVGAQRQL